MSVPSIDAFRAVSIARQEVKSVSILGTDQIPKRFGPVIVESTGEFIYNRAEPRVYREPNHGIEFVVIQTFLSATLDLSESLYGNEECRS